MYYPNGCFTAVCYREFPKNKIVGKVGHEFEKFEHSFKSSLSSFIAFIKVTKYQSFHLSTKLMIHYSCKTIFL